MDNAKPPTPKVPGKRHSFSSDFKKEAVARLKSTSNVSALAEELGVRRNLLYKWEKQLEAVGPAATMRSPGRPLASELSELDRLRKANAQLELENAILKKAQAYFKAR